MTQSCPCGSAKVYAQCCEPMHMGERNATTAEELLRSRYSAYDKGEVDYICRTIHPKHSNEYDKAGIQKWAMQAIWNGLSIISVEKGGEQDSEGWVEFKAFYEQNDKEHILHEVSYFKKAANAWFYISGEAGRSVPLQRESPKVGRNAPCPCGSGKKHKKCCATA
ncbi:MAG: YchJ family protein [Chitinivibrionales bacterium]|nr:YchJ family protein [Chitinivibrionales bacterium]